MLHAEANAAENSLFASFTPSFVDPLLNIWTDTGDFWLPCSEKLYIIGQFLLKLYHNMTHRRTDRWIVRAIVKYVLSTLAALTRGNTIMGQFSYFATYAVNRYFLSFIVLQLTTKSNCWSVGEREYFADGKDRTPLITHRQHCMCWRQKCSWRIASNHWWWVYDCLWQWLCLGVKPSDLWTSCLRQRRSG